MKTNKKINKKDRGFFIYDKSWYKIPERERESEINFGIYPGDGEQGTHGEMSVVWIDLGQYGIAPQLRAFCDSFNVLNSFGDLIRELSKLDSIDFTQDQFVEILLKCGFRDLTNYTRKK